MKRRRILLLLALAVIVVMGFLVFWPQGPREPVYQGKRFSRWIEQLEATTGMDTQSHLERRETARKAIRAIGTNALPYLLHELTRPISQWRIKFNRWAEGNAMVPLRFGDEEARTWQAADGLYILGPDSAAALPVLASCLRDPQRGFAAARAMSGAGTLAVPHLLPAITAADLPTARKALGSLGDIAKEHESAVPILVQFVTHTNGSIRQWAASHLAVIETHTELTVPVLTRALSDPEPGVRQYAANALGGIGPKAKAAVPELLRLMKQSPSSAAQAASNAVFHIDPTALPAREP